MTVATCARILPTLYLFALATSASAESAWVLWKYQDMVYTAQPAPIEVIDAFETRADCVRAINTLEGKYKEARYQRIDRMNDTTLFVASGPLGHNREEIQVTCRPDTVDPRGPTGSK
jgi:hypothetical protein